LYGIVEEWEKSVPAGLIPAVKHLRESFDEAHFGCGQTTRIFGFAALHNEAPDDPDKGFSRYLLHMQKIIGVAGAREYWDSLRIGTPPAIFKAYYDMYLNGVSAQALHVFTQLIGIGGANQLALETPFLEWAESQTRHMIRSQKHWIRIWVQEVCHRRVYDPNEDSESQIFWSKWQAPSLIIMTPSRHRLYEPDKAWELNEPAISTQWLKMFQDDYVLRLEMKLRKVAGETAVELAKQPKAPRDPVVPVNLAPKQEQSPIIPPVPEGRSGSNTIRRDARKLDTEAKYRLWRAEYRRLKRRRSGMSDVWYAEQIAKMSIAGGCSAETIRKNMTEK